MDLKDFGAAGFYLQQAVEKFLKAFLLSKNWELKRIHDLEALLNAALKFVSSLESYRSVCQTITGFYFVERYPLMVETGLTEQDVQDALDAVSGLIETLRTLLNDEADGPDRSSEDDRDDDESSVARVKEEPS